MTPPRNIAAVRLSALALFSMAVGCVPAPRGPVDLRRAEVLQIRIGLQHPRVAVCPGRPVAIDVAMDVETDAGDTLHLVQHRREIDDAIFDPFQLYLESPQGSFEGGVFFPDPDARVSLGTGFVFHARPPRGPAFSVRFPPYYECGGRVGGEGLPGMPGRDFAEHAPNNPLHPGGPAVRGATRTTTVDGAPGLPGPRLRVFVTWVKTSDYARLLAARTTGDVDMVGFSAPGYPLHVFATGGVGGRGGQGARGAEGGAGAQGGKGGDGGRGGEVEVVLDERFAELESMIAVDVSGGAGGAGGASGPGGEPARREKVFETSRRRWMGYEIVGERGPVGPRGPAGRTGEYGTFTVRRADVRSSFVGVGALTVL